LRYPMRCGFAEGERRKNYAFYGKSDTLEKEKAYPSVVVLIGSKGEFRMENCSIVTKPALHLIGISYCGPYSTFPDEAIRLQSEFLARKHELQAETNTSALYSPYFGNEVFATYWACYETHPREELPLPPGMVQFTIPPHRYAMAGCSNKRIGEGYEQLKSWMHEMGLQKDDSALCLEIFYIDEHHLEEEPVELLIPLKE